jgi:hypothetical protein
VKNIVYMSPWRVHAIKGRWKSNWTCSITEHNCYPEADAKKTNRNMISPFVANIIYGLIVDNLALEHKMIIRHIQCTLLVHYKIHKGLYDKGKGVRDEIRHIWDLV